MEGLYPMEAAPGRGACEQRVVRAKWVKEQTSESEMRRQVEVFRAVSIASNERRIKSDRFIVDGAPNPNHEAQQV